MERRKERERNSEVEERDGCEGGRKRKREKWKGMRRGKKSERGGRERKRRKGGGERSREKWKSGWQRERGRKRRRREKGGEGKMKGKKRAYTPFSGGEVFLFTRSWAEGGGREGQTEAAGI